MDEVDEMDEEVNEMDVEANNMDEDKMIQRQAQNGDWIAPTCKDKSIRFRGEEIAGAGDALDITGLWYEGDRIRRGRKECQALCRTHPEALVWNLRYFQDQKCSCFKQINESKPHAEYYGGRVCPRNDFEVKL